RGDRRGTSWLLSLAGLGPAPTQRSDVDLARRVLGIGGEDGIELACGAGDHPRVDRAAKRRLDELELARDRRIDDARSGKKPASAAFDILARAHLDRGEILRPARMPIEHISNDRRIIGVDLQYDLAAAKDLLDGLASRAERGARVEAKLSVV